MGKEVVVVADDGSYEELKILSRREAETGRKNQEKEEEIVVKWERLFPKMVFRVLLVEADDSTRQIISALLKKCGYRVAAVPDGLKAWEILKGRSHNIDLILTEVDLPSISGYPLLTLIMEHDICKNIPVIMMSSQDSISTVYKCMLRGASDYLVKPIRRNELINLWQHVWRRRSSLVGGNIRQDESVGQDKVEATSENDAASNRSNGDIACVRRSNEYVEKLSDDQSSCTKPDMEVECTHMQNMQELVRPVWGKFPLNDLQMQNHDANTYCQKFPMDEHETRGLVVGTYKESIMVTMDMDIEPQCRRDDANVTSVACDNNDVLVGSSREVIDFMGTDHNSSSSCVKGKFDAPPRLDLSLRRSPHPFGFEVQVSEERHTLRQSDASAFTRYTNRSAQPLHSTLASVHYNTELGAHLERKLSINAGSCNSDTRGLVPPRGQRSTKSLANGQTEESEIATPSPQQRAFPIQVPVESIRFNNMCTGYGSAFPSVFCKQSGGSPTPSPSSASRPEASFKVHQSNLNRNSETLYDRLGLNANDSASQSIQNHEHKSGGLEDQGHISVATDQSASSSFYNGAASHLNSIGYGSTSGSNNSNVDQVAIVRTAEESKNEDTVFLHNANSRRTIQREAALTKFRMKRKDRCFEKKVRYESRKKLAEQRPRVKGQFVRQAHTDPPHSESN